jgi:hypothetical protein
LLDPFRTELARLVPGARVTPPLGQAADGALRLARRGLPPEGAGPYAVEFSR